MELSRCQLNIHRCLKKKRTARLIEIWELATYGKAWEWEEKQDQRTNLDKILTLVTSQRREKPGKNSEDWLEELRRECCYEREERFFFQCVNYRTLFGGILWILYSQLRIMFLRKKMFLRILNVRKDNIKIN